MTKKRILLVDDEPRFLKTTKKLLENRHFHVNTATGGLEALESLRREPVNVVILDVKMPGMDGITALKKIRKEFPDIEVMMLTGHATVQDAVAGLRQGAADYLMKPVDIDGLTEKLEELFARHQVLSFQGSKRKEKFRRLKIRLFSMGLALVLIPALTLLGIGTAWLGEICRMLGGDALRGSLLGMACLNIKMIVWVSILLIGLMAAGLSISLQVLLKWMHSQAEKRDIMQFQLFHASRLASISELAGGVAHEINNPLAIIVARCGIIEDLLNSGSIQEKDRQAFADELEIIKQASFRARTITRQLIHFSRNVEPMLLPCNINEILGDIIDTFNRQSATDNRIQLVYHFDPGMPITRLDPVRIGHALTNIVQNAFDAIESEGTVTITTAFKRDQIEVDIGDTGKGMGIEQIEHIFKPFYTTKKNGTGLSLSLTQRIIESHGGTIEVRSEEGAGSTFSITLPTAT